ncbi:response regulator [Paenibacillus rhizovicinus]|uniref:Response regulator n=1 Tax=Paenibacillus rhizovicinus TaxID=2704463 RepID=A0A6C0P3M7_9BACL|nr:response regulator [Paenibacillus rhizovicinus]QHW33077.1 response regulator [Paenibacillus rhizovicinus]
MLNIVIVDDEEIIRLGLAKMIGKLSGEYQVAGSFEDGEEALAALEELGASVDLIITDIKMPYLDGLSFIERLREKHPEMPCVILSGYNDFEYARRAIQSGVDDYMLKPVDAQELAVLLGKVAQRRERLRADEERQELSSRQLEAGQREERLRRLLAGGAGEESVLPNEGQGAILVFRSSNPLVQESLLHYLHALKEQIREAVVMQEGLVAAVVLLSGREAVQQPQRALRAVSLRVMDHLQIRGGGFLAIGECFADPQAGAAGWSRAYRDALAASRHLFSADRGNVLQSAADLKTKAEPWRLTAPVLEEQLKTACEMLDAQAIKALLPRFFAEAEQGKAGYEEVIHLANHLFYTLATRIDGFADALQGLQGGNFDFHQRAAALYAIQDVRDWLVSFAVQVMEALEPGRTANGNRAIEKAKAWIQEHYRKEIELTVLSETVFLNASYFSYLFKRETGQTITEYVTMVRMAKAKEYLKERLDLKAYQVGEMVGYADGIYFNKLFKKTIGVTPQQYRNQTLGR